jgi:ABC-type phosphate/phosphonate transport system permease subunit
MNKSRSNVFFALSALLLLFLLLWQSWNFGRLQLEAAFAEDQTRIFDDMRQQALQSDATGAAESLGYVVNYYPSGTKQRAGSRLDKVVERERASVTHDIISYLRQKTGEDLGENSEAWIKKYAKNK